MIIIAIAYQVTDEIWVCDKQTITKWDGDIFSYKQHLRSKIDEDDRKYKTMTERQENDENNSVAVVI